MSLGGGGHMGGAIECETLTEQGAARILWCVVIRPRPGDMSPRISHKTACLMLLWSALGISIASDEPSPAARASGASTIAEARGHVVLTHHDSRAPVAVSPGDAEASAMPMAVTLPLRSPAQLEAFRAAVQEMVDEGDIAAAAEQVWQAARQSPRFRADLMAFWYEVKLADTERYPDMITLEPGSEISEIDFFTGSSAIIARLKRGAETFAAFKPHQSIRNMRYRGSIATYRLCVLLHHCTFHMPMHREVRFAEDDFYQLSGITPGPTRFLSDRSRLEWFVDAQGQRWLHGVLKTWEENIQTRFPVEYRDLWKPWMQIGNTADKLHSVALGAALRPLKRRKKGNPKAWYRAVMDQAPEGATIYDFTQQFSDLLVVDILANNWDRFSRYCCGTQCPWRNGTLVQIDNGATFPLPDERSNRGTATHIKMIQLFSRSNIEAIRWMNTEAAFRVLFPKHPFHDDDRARFDNFLKRRQTLLNHVDQLVALHGEEAVFVYP